MPRDNDRDISFGIEGLDEAFYSVGDWDNVPAERYAEAELTQEEVLNTYWNGFIDPNVDPDVRHYAREMFFEFLDLLDLSGEDFDWEAWREAMGYGD